jgi:hypothetical protein
VIQAERALHREVMWQLRAARPDCVVVPVPNGTWIPARTDAERRLVGRIIAQMKADGQLLPGASDLLMLWRDGCGAIELKAPAVHTFLGRRQAGRPGPAQLEFERACAEHGVRHIYASGWGEVRNALESWGRL